jgi:hypothetical protein
MNKPAHPFLSHEGLYAPDVRKQFNRRRIAVVPQAVSAEACEAVLCSIRSSKFIVVDDPNDREVTCFYTKNGDGLIATCPEISEIERGLLEWISDISGETYLPLDNRAIGISLNVTPPGGGFGTHHDRQAITIVLYLNDADGGALHVYPAFPRWFRHKLQGHPAPRMRAVRRHAIKSLNMSPGFGAKAVHRLLFRPVRINPRAGTVAAFTKLSDHRVDPVAPGSVRVGLVVAGDRPGVSFKEGQKYYGYALEEIMLGDLFPPDEGTASSRQFG